MDFFSKVGQVLDVRLISDRNSRRSKGIGYVEFTDKSAVPMVTIHCYILLLLLHSLVPNCYLFFVFLSAFERVLKTEQYGCNEAAILRFIN